MLVPGRAKNLQMNLDSCLESTTHSGRQVNRWGSVSTRELTPLILTQKQLTSPIFTFSYITYKAPSHTKVFFPFWALKYQFTSSTFQEVPCVLLEGTRNKESIRSPACAIPSLGVPALGEAAPSTGFRVLQTWVENSTPLPGPWPKVLIYIHKTLIVLLSSCSIRKTTTYL